MARRYGIVMSPRSRERRTSGTLRFQCASIEESGYRGASRPPTQTAVRQRRQYVMRKQSRRYGDRREAEMSLRGIAMLREVYAR